MQMLLYSIVYLILKKFSLIYPIYFTKCPSCKIWYIAVQYSLKMDTAI